MRCMNQPEEIITFGRTEKRSKKVTDKRIPEIPQFVADWIDYHTDLDSLSDTIHFVIY